jgi:hypothetical protein
MSTELVGLSDILEKAYELATIKVMSLSAANRVFYSDARLIEILAIARLSKLDYYVELQKNQLQKLKLDELLNIICKINHLGIVEDFRPFQLQIRVLTSNQQLQSLKFNNGTFN